MVALCSLAGPFLRSYLLLPCYWDFYLHPSVRGRCLLGGFGLGGRWPEAFPLSTNPTSVSAYHPSGVPVTTLHFSQPAMPPLPTTLTDLPGRFLRLLKRNTVPRRQSLLCDYTSDVSLPALHEVIRTLGDITIQTPMHLCDSWRWLALEGELCAVSDLQATFTMNGVLLTITTDIKTPTGVQIITHYLVAMASNCLC